MEAPIGAEPPVKGPVMAILMVSAANTGAASIPNNNIVINVFFIESLLFQ
jgi:hypothetical protein